MCLLLKSTNEGSDIISQLALSMLKMCSSYIRADSYSFYLYDNLFLPIANYFPGCVYSELNDYPYMANTPLADYMKKHRCAVSNSSPEIQALWEKSTMHRLLIKSGLEYVLAAPLLHNGDWMGSINISRADSPFTNQDLEHLDFISKLIVVFFESSEMLVRNNAYVSISSDESGVASLMVHNLNLTGQHIREETPSAGLSDREKQVLDFLAEGYSYKSIADEMCVSINTVKYHVKNIYRKSGINSKIRLIRTLYE